MHSSPHSKIQNSIANAAKGEIFYGIHFYPGVAEYEEPGKEPYRVFLNGNTLRAMDPTFAGRPVFVQHVDDVDDNIDVVKNEADGWVVESFFNPADGKHWVKFVIVSERGKRAIKNGMRLSNSYYPKNFAQGGLWNGVAYAKEITGGEYEHLAIVPNPRYEESVILSPEQYKKYCEDKEIELKKLSNERKESRMKFFKKAKVENSADIENMSVVLPKSGKEVTIVKLINDADDHEEKKDMNAGMADPAHKVKIHDGSYMNVGDLVAAHKKLHDELEAMKKHDDDDMHNDEEDQDKEYAEKGEPAHNKEGKDMPKGDTPSDLDNDEGDEDAKKKALQLAEHEEKEIEAAKKKNAREKAAKLRNAHLQEGSSKVIELSSDRLERGRIRYGSN